MGVSHFLEHLVFKGTRSMGPHEIALSIEQLGGSLDAYTSRDHTAFQARVLDEDLDEAARVIAELIFHPMLRESDLKLERKVILEEIGSVEDQPDDLVFELHNDALFAGSPYGHTILGTRETIKALSIADVRSLHERAFRPPLIVVAASGNVEHDRLLAALEKSGWMAEPGGGANVPATPELSSEPTPSAIAKVRDTSQVHLVMGSRGITSNDPRRHAFGLVSMLLGDGMSSRLFQKVREDLGLAYSVHTFTESFLGAGAHGVYLGTSPETCADAERVVKEELGRLSAEGLSEADLALAKRQLKGQVTLSMEGVSSRMYRAAASELYGRPWRDLDGVLADIEVVTVAETRQVCEDFFAPERQSTVRLGPQA